jgi:hypothetical protein
MRSMMGGKSKKLIKLGLRKNEMKRKGAVAGRENVSALMGSMILAHNEVKRKLNLIP